MSQTCATFAAKRMRLARQNEAGYVQMQALQVNKAYKVYKLEATNHAEYGPGQLAYIIFQPKLKLRVQLPNKFLRLLAEVDANAIDDFKAAINRGNHPFLIYREKDVDKSYDLHLLDATSELLIHYRNGTDVPALAIEDRVGTPPPSPSVGLDEVDESAEDVKQ